MKVDLSGPCACERSLFHYALLNVANYRQGQAAAKIDDYLEWMADHGTFRKRANRAARLGYTVQAIEPRDWNDAYREINTSSPERQGRPMSEAYRTFSGNTSLIGPPKCPFHHVKCYGVLDDFGELRAYSTFYRVGDLVHLSQFLGHAALLDDGIMYLLIREVIRDQLEVATPIVLYYNRFDSGTDGLRFFKTRVGLEEVDIEWIIRT